MGKIVGIDAGTNSLSVFVRDKEGKLLHQKILDYDFCVVNTFPSGAGSDKKGEFSLAAQRTGFRCKRKQYRHKRYRRWSLLELLIENNMCPLTIEELKCWRQYNKLEKVQRQFPINSERFMQWMRSEFGGKVIPPYELRYELVTRELDFSKEENLMKLGRALYHIALHRGFKSSKNDTSEEKENNSTAKNDEQDVDLSTRMKASEEKKNAAIGNYMDEHKIPTVGAALYLLNQEGIRIRNNNQYQAIRQRNLEEVDYIFKFQKLLDKYPDLYQRLIKDDNNGTIFYQRPLRSQKGNVGKCTLEPSKTRCPISRPEYETFRAWDFINKIRYGEGCKQELSLELKQKLYREHFVRATNFEFETIRKFIEKETQESYSYDLEKNIRTINYSDNTPVLACSVTYRLKKLLGDEWNTWQYITNKTRKTASKKSTHVITYSWEDLWHICFMANDAVPIVAIAEITGLSTKDMESLWSAIKMDYASLSLKAINNINRFLTQGYEYSVACLLAKLPELLKQRWNDVENEILLAVENIVKTNRHEQDIATIVNRIIANYKMNKDCRYEDVRLAVLKEEIQEYTTEYYGSQWYTKTKDEKQIIIEQVENLFDNFIEDGCGAYIRKPTIENRFDEYLTKYKIDSKQIYHHSTTDYYPKAPLQRIENEEAIISRKLLQSPVIASLRNPMAMRVLHTLRKVINELIINGVINEDDTEVVVEVARELNDANKRWAIKAYNEKRRKENEEFENIIAEYIPKQKISDEDVRKLRYMVEQHELLDFKEKCKKEIFWYKENDIDKLVKKYRLWIEQGCMCIYTGRPIKISDLFDGTNMVDIEHTLPRSKTFDDSLENQTLCYAYFNRGIKKNLIPSQLDNHKEILQRIKPWQEKVKRLENVCNYWSKRVKSAPDKNRKDEAIRQRHYWRMELDYWCGKVNRFTMKEIPSNYRNNQLVDTGIITKYIYHFLKSVFSKVNVQKGSTTATFRKLLGLQASNETKDRSTHIHHAIDAAVLTFIPGSMHRDEILKLYYEISEIKRMGHDASDKEKALDYYLGHHCGLYRNHIARLRSILEKDVVVQHRKKDQTLTLASRRYRVNGKVIPLRDAQGRIIYEIDAEGNFIRDVFGHKIPQAKYWQRGDSIRGSLHNEFFYGAIKNNEGDICYVIRRPIDQLSKGDIKNIVDERIRNIIEEHWDTKEFHLISRDGKKIPIRHVRCFCNNIKNPIKLKFQTYLSTSDYKQSYYVQNNVSYAICRYQSIEETKYLVYSLFDVSENDNKRADVNAYWHIKKQGLPIELNEKPKITQLILKGDMLLIGAKNEDWHNLSTEQLLKRLHIVCGFKNDRNSVRIKLRLHTNAENESQWSSIKDFNNLPQCIQCSINTIQYLKLNDDFFIRDGRIVIKG
ncbi:MAG: hypothetical protein IKV15_03235 [Bacteroidaceae bacterium]|nr:hypothetical protein [Bacteroidaceae bacterium]